MIRYIICLIIICIGSDAAAQTFIDSIIAVVNEDAITHSELENEFRIAALMGIRPDTRPTAAEKRAVLNTLINRKFALQEADSSGIVITSRESRVAAKITEISAKYSSETAFQDALQRYQLERASLEAQVYDQLIYDEFFRRIFFTAINSEEVAKLAKAYYDANSAEFIVPPTVTFNALLIVMPEEGSAAEKRIADERVRGLNERLQQGGEFQAVLETYGTQLELKFDVRTLEVDTPVGALVTQLEVSERSAPFNVPEGYLIVERIRHNSAYQKTYEDVREEITERTRQEMANQQFEKWLTEKKEQETWDILDNELAQEKSEVN